jgi:hypothetical protein
MIHKHIRSALAGLSVLFALAALAGCDAMTSPGLKNKVMPDAPTNVSVTATSSSTLSVSWTGSSAATSYRIYYSTSSTFSSYSSSTTASSTYCSLTGLSSSTTYYVWVAGVNSYGTGPNSSVASGTTSYGSSTTSSSLSAPSWISASTNSNTSVKVSWGSVSNATGYYVYYGTTSTPTTYVGSTTSTSTIVTGLTYGTTYYFRVKAYNSYGTSTYSATDYSKPGYY